MKTIRLINQHIPIWSMLCGDHALKAVVNNINPKLLTEPNFSKSFRKQVAIRCF